MVAGPSFLGISCLLMTQTGQVKEVPGPGGPQRFQHGHFLAGFQAWIAESHSGAGLARNIGSFNMSWTASHLIGPTLSGLLFGLHSRLPFWLAAALCLSLFFVMRLRLEREFPSSKGDRISAF